MIRKVVAAFLFALSFGLASAYAQEALAPVEARVPYAPGAFVGSDGLTHLAYELHITNFYGDTGSLKPMGLKVFADDAQKPLVVLDANELSRMIRPTPPEHESASILPGKRAVIFVWITLPAETPVPHTLRHRIEFATDKHAVALLDGATVQVSNETPLVIGPPLRGGRWIAHEGPGAAQSHHWGSLVAVNGQLTIPQRYALDLVGLDPVGHAMRAGVKDIQKSTYADWIGYGANVLAVADGVVRSARDGEEEHQPLSPQPEPTSLTTNGLFGNYVVLEVAPGVFASYAHLQRGSLKVRPGDRVHRGQVLAHLGQSGNSAAPHLHFQLSNAATFEGAEGVPYVFDSFDFLGHESEAQLFGQGDPWKAAAIEHRRAQMPLNDVVIQFPSQ
ncbi:M23 family metallopeptidase [Dyella tabacisoli]|uniref:M23 family peptidase n=1 Tax=Dyella tabacisoli TaxID=2282381 RepID=A0A369UL59_9GAMM|nr:M23 family metallopeptidase [Dyella tabacisoli]RDD81502.1 M23 family peptidase [Dyella tabacisoli]